MAKCNWNSEAGWLTPEHVRDCDDTLCRGCKPCPRSHCGMRGRCAHHVQAESGVITCASCVGKVRSDLAAIVDLYEMGLHEEAEDAGVESEAFVLIGPSALPGSVDYRRGFCEFPRSDERHPYAVLATWDLALREQYGPPTDLAITVQRAADYLTGLLAGAFPHGDEFEDFSREIGACRAHLEQVVHDSRTPEQGRHCPRCVELSGKGPRLQKRYARGDDERTKAGNNDTWHCPAESEHWWTERDYRDRVAADYVGHAKELPARELAERINRPISTIRKWAARSWEDDAKQWRDPLLISRKRGEDGRKLYPVEVAERLARDIA